MDKQFSNFTTIRFGDIYMTSKPAKTAALPEHWHKSILKKQADQEKMRTADLHQVEVALRSLEKNISGKRRIFLAP